MLLELHSLHQLYQSNAYNHHDFDMKMLFVYIRYKNDFLIELHMDFHNDYIYNL